MAYSLSRNKKRISPWAFPLASLTLLLVAILIAFFSASRTDQNKWAELLYSLHRAFGTPAQPVIRDIFAENPDDPIEFKNKILLLHPLSPLIDSHHAEVETIPEGFRMRIKGDALFLPDGPWLHPGVKPRLQAIAAVLASIDNAVQVTGYGEGSGATAEAAPPPPSPPPPREGVAQPVAFPQVATPQGEPLLGLSQTRALHRVSKGERLPVAGPSSTRVELPARATGEEGRSGGAPVTGLAYATEVVRFLAAEGGLANIRIQSRGLSLSALPAKEAKEGEGGKKTSESGQPGTIEILIARVPGVGVGSAPSGKPSQAETGK